MDASLVIDQQTILTYLSFLGFALFGSFMRTMFGLYRGYTGVPGFQPERKRMAVEMIASTCFGVFLALMLNEIGVFKFAPTITALAAGLLGADLMSLITKKLGVSKGMNVILSESQMKYAGMTDRQIRAIEYVRRNGSIDNQTYRDLNSTGHSSAKKDLGHMVSKGRLRRVGTGKGTRYVFTKQFEGQMRSSYGSQKTGALKGTQKGPEEPTAVRKADFEACRRILETFRNGRTGTTKK